MKVDFVLLVAVIHMVKGSHDLTPSSVKLGVSISHILSNVFQLTWTEECESNNELNGYSRNDSIIP